MDQLIARINSFKQQNQKDFTTSLNFSVKLIELKNQGKSGSKKGVGSAKREIWTDSELNQLIQMSVQGCTRSQMEKVFQRTTGKIFSKIQKHVAMLSKVQEYLK